MVVGGDSGSWRGVVKEVVGVVGAYLIMLGVWPKSRSKPPGLGFVRAVRNGGGA
jgi:hypothetical protein